jgi:putative beta-lysine N-acetyltransferase
MAARQNYGKVFVKVRSIDAENFHRAGYVEEASVPCLYGGSETGIFMGYYLNEQRVLEPDADILDNILHLAYKKSGEPILPVAADQFILKRCEERDVEEMAAIYRTVFATYPFPIHDRQYLTDSMKSHVVYFGVERNGHLIALSSAEIDKSALNAEMTDFATLPHWQGNNLSVHLLLRMEKELKQKGIITAYTIARALSPGMNIAFSKSGYTYGGRLNNNTNIAGKIESMNVWYKTVS